MNDAPVVPAIVKPEPKVTVAKKKPVAKKVVKKAPAKKAVKKPDAKKARKIVRKAKRRAFPYLRVAKMWRTGKSSMDIAKSVGRYDSKAADPMHSFRVTLTRFHKGVRINGKLVKLPHRVSKAALKRATKAGRKAVA